jgi:hypothetical protein
MNISDTKAKLYKTARATKSCLHFNAGDIVAISNPWRGNDGILWFDIKESQHGPCNTTYPEHHLTDFVL